MKYYIKESIKQTERVFPMPGRYGLHRYDMNENPEGLPKEFVNQVLKEITPEFLSTYPEPGVFLRKYASFVGVEDQNVLVSNGSDMAIRYLLETFGEPGKDVVTVSPSFEMYRINCSILGLNHIPVLYEKDLTIQIDKIIDAISEKTRIVVLLNPNNPVGNVYTEEDFGRILDRASTVGAVVIVDEAYHYFYDKTFIKYTLNYENVVVLRTFSKLMSIAALRLGVIIGSKELISHVRKSQLSFDTNAVALLFGERLLENPDIIERLIQNEKEGKTYLMDRLKEHGYDFKECKGNFILVKPNHKADFVAQRLKEKNVLIHTFNNVLLKDYIRISIGSKTAMEIFFDAFLEVDHF